jgi:hypothetical protein
MKKIHLLPVLLFGLVLIVSCKNAATTSESASTDENSFGAGVSNPDAAVSLAEVSNQLNSADTVKAVLRAKVSEVCQAKGCWMNIIDAASESEDPIFVQFQDYGFFVPKDIAGQDVIIEGIAYKEVSTVEELRHYAEDAGKSAEEIAAIIDPVMEKKFMATGVLLLK